MNIRDHSNNNSAIKEAQELADYMVNRDKERMKVINSAFLLPRKEKWRRIVDMYKNEVPGLARVYKDNILLAKQQREEAGIWNKHVENETGSMRLGLVMPPAVLTIIETCDPEFKEIMKSNTDTAGQKKMFKLLCKAFPEFVVPQVL